MELKAKYFDGSVREGHEALVELLSEKIRIQPVGQGYISPVYWETGHAQRLKHHKINTVLLQNTALPKQYIEFDTGDFERHIAPYYAGKPLVTPMAEKPGTVWKPVMVIAIIVIAVLALGYFVAVPMVADGFARIVPKETEATIGETMYNSTIAGYTVNDSATVIINELFAKIKHPNDYTIKITVVKENQVNAFAMPGGHIVVFDGILKQMDASPQLCALLAHEFSHVQHRHTTRSIFRSLANYLFISIIIGDAGSISGIIAQRANSLKEMGYSRGFEKDADLEGFKILTENNIDPSGMIQMFEKLETAARGTEIPEFLSTHPVTTNRKKYVQEKIAEGGFTVSRHEDLEQLFVRLKEVVKN